MTDAEQAVIEAAIRLRLDDLGLDLDRAARWSRYEAEREIRVIRKQFGQRSENLQRALCNLIAERTRELLTGAGKQ